MDYISMYLSLLGKYLPYIIIIGLLLIGLGAFLAHRYGINRHRLMDWWRPNSARHYDSILFCEDREIVDRRMTIGRYVICDHLARRAYYLVHKVQLTRPNGQKILALSQRSARPIDFHRVMTKAEWLAIPKAQRVFLDTTNDINTTTAKNAGGNSTMTGLTIIALCVAITVCVIGALQLAM